MTGLSVVASSAGSHSIFHVWIICALQACKKGLSQVLSQSLRLRAEAPLTLFQAGKEPQDTSFLCPQGGLGRDTRAQQ